MWVSGRAKYFANNLMTLVLRYFHCIMCAVPYELLILLILLRNKLDSAILPRSRLLFVS